MFKDLRQETINDISEIAVQESYDNGAQLFAKGDPANYFYILMEGRVKLTIGEKNPMVLGFLLKNQTRSH
jgi:CRP-like cAMP-binding protein